MIFFTKVLKNFKVPLLELLGHISVQPKCITFKLKEFTNLSQISTFCLVSVIIAVKNRKIIMLKQGHSFNPKLLKNTTSIIILV